MAVIERALLWTEQEAADRLCLSARTLRKLRQDGEIRYVALTGRRVAYRPEDCQDFIERRTRQHEQRKHRPPRPNRRGTNAGNSANVVSFTARRAARKAGGIRA